MASLALWDLGGFVAGSGLLIILDRTHIRKSNEIALIGKRSYVLVSSQLMPLFGYVCQKVYQ